MSLRDQMRVGKMAHRDHVIPKVDNSLVPLKSHLRLRMLPPDARVLDLFCGAGEIYHSTYKGRVGQYRGVDKKKVHDQTLCTIEDNVRYLNTRGADGYNVFDLDDYGCPWPLIHLVLSKATEPEIVLFVTDGMPARMRLTGDPSKILSATNRIPRWMSIPGIFRWYVPTFKTMIVNAAARYNYRVVDALRADNRLKQPRQSVSYWGIRLERLTNV